MSNFYNKLKFPALFSVQTGGSKAQKISIFCRNCSQGNGFYFDFPPKHHQKCVLKSDKVTRNKVTPFRHSFADYSRSSFQISPWIGRIMPCGGPKRTFGWTIPDGPWISTISRQTRSFNSHPCTKLCEFNCRI